MSHTSRRGTDPSKPRKPYVITKQREPWTDEEHELFLEALELYERDWKKIQEHVKNKTVKQLRSHAQKHFQKLGKSSIGVALPKPTKRSRYEPYELRERISDQNEGSLVLTESSPLSSFVSVAYDGPSNPTPGQEGEDDVGMPEDLLRQAYVASAIFAQLEPHVARERLMNALACASEDRLSELRAENAPQGASAVDDQRDAGLMAWFREQMARNYLSDADSYAPPRSFTLLEKLSSSFNVVRFQYQKLMHMSSSSKRTEFEADVRSLYSPVKPPGNGGGTSHPVTPFEMPPEPPPLTTMQSTVSSPNLSFSSDNSNVSTPNQNDNDNQNRAYLEQSGQFDYNGVAELLNSFPVPSMPVASVPLHQDLYSSVHHHLDASLFFGLESTMMDPSCFFNLASTDFL